MTTRPRRICAVVLGASVALLLAIPRGAVAVSTATTEHTLDRAATIYLTLAQELSPEDGYPRAIVQGRDWHLLRPSAWTSGFFPGILWQLYGHTQDEQLLEQAMRWTEGLEGQANAPTHDVGFIIHTSFGQGFEITGLEEYREVTLEAADHLAGRFNENVGAIQSWSASQRFRYPVVIDGLMNLELLSWAARNGGDPALVDIAKAHASTTRRDHVRDDGSSYHLIDYEPDWGGVVWRGTVQGLADDSMWARGQAWGLYGFAIAYRETGEAEFLEASRRMADTFLDRLPADGVPYWDFDVGPGSGEPRDSSAAAIAASGLFELASLIDDPAATRHYRLAAAEILESLLSEEYSAWQAGLPALLLHGTGHRPRNREVDVPLIYADYYFIEALLKQVSCRAGSNER
jgi:unsaturated chondroitin disaccharide hydrolase